MTDAATSEDEFRELLVLHGRSVFERGLTSGSSGNLSVRLADGILITPTNACLGRLAPRQISKIDWDGRLLAGDTPSKEAFLHLAMYRARPSDAAVVHLHSTHSVAVSCLANLNAENALPPITAYYVMRVGRLPLLPYYPPGEPALASEVERAGHAAHALLLANHGPVVSGSNLEAAVNATEELEETAKLHLLLLHKETRYLTAAQCAELNRRFPS